MKITDEEIAMMFGDKAEVEELIAHMGSYYVAERARLQQVVMTTMACDDDDSM